MQRIVFAFLKLIMFVNIPEDMGTLTFCGKMYFTFSIRGGVKQFAGKFAGNFPNL